MSVDGVTTYEQLLAMTQAEREAHFDTHIVWDLDELTPRQRELLALQSRRVLARENRLRDNGSQPCRGVEPES